ncbi:shikimate dehydrogenase [Gammaproteobacteria bacterium]|nr:shikimate dehydrogenase [Gammaproteobacteria bacterium]
MDKKLKLAVIGKPIGHSKSPEIHKDFANQFDAKIEFRKDEVTPETLETWLSDFFKDGGKGVSITLPLKEEALNYADEISDRARLASACNVIYAKDERLFADCTDGYGFTKDLEENLKVPVKDKKILILGAGGAARGIIPSIIEKKPAKLKVANRTESKALLLREDLEVKVNLKEKDTIFEAGGLSDDFLLDDSYDLVINSTAISTQTGESIGLPKALFKDIKLAYDLFYSAENTVFMNEALAAGAEKVSDGWGMLVEQGAESFRLWTNLIPDTSRLLEKPID